ncbi:hypothetical protein DCAR_0313112 [Daucus carota subsp. sativus]|uniref:Uncharacterized protein n=1 Tax=Daucus carota subsp. sativus TaxID=79200 RepID=A0A161Y136_DAUCS|nr:hypothetical protein DCAR_0313112 [Daucus carota subsp. sativus]
MLDGRRSTRLLRSFLSLNLRRSTTTSVPVGHLSVYAGNEMERLIRADKSPNLHPIAQQIGSSVWLQAERRASDPCDVVCFERVELVDDWSLDGGILVCHHVPLKIADVGLGISVSGKGFYCASVPLKSYTHELKATIYVVRHSIIIEMIEWQSL